MGSSGGVSPWIWWPCTCEGQRGGEDARSGGKVLVVPVSCNSSLEYGQRERAGRKKERKETSGRGGGILRGWVGAPVVACSGGATAAAGRQPMGQGLGKRKNMCCIDTFDAE